MMHALLAVFICEEVRYGNGGPQFSLPMINIIITEIEQRMKGIFFLHMNFDVRALEVRMRMCAREFMSHKMLGIVKDPYKKMVNIIAYNNNLHI